MNTAEKIAVITGGARGIGAATTELFANERYRVIVADVLDEEGRRLAERLGDKADFVPLDVTSESAWRNLVDYTEQTHGPVSVLVNNAGILDFGTVVEQDPKAFQRVIEVNLFGAWLGMHVCAPSLRRDGGGVIVNVSSIAGLIGYANLGSYVASKWGLRGLTKTAALELAEAGIRVCSIHPGPIKTPMTAGFDDSMTAGQPIARFGEPDEVARMILFAARDATYSTGSEFVVDGGATVGSLLVADKEPS